MTINPWVKRGLVVLAVVGAFVGGRFSAPAQVQTREVERVVYKDRVITKTVTVEVAAKQTTRVVYRDRVVTPDGTIREHEVEREATKEEAAKVAVAQTVKTEKSDARIEHETKTELRPDWRVSILAGASLQPPAIPLTGPAVFGAMGERRIVGGLSAGVWIMPQFEAGGAVVSLEF